MLCLGLKRFDFDFTTLSRVKLHHAVRVPPVLDMAPYLDGGAVARQHTSTKRKLIGAVTPNATPNLHPGEAPADMSDVPPLSPLPPSAAGSSAAPTPLAAAALSAALDAGSNLTTADKEAARAKSMREEGPNEGGLEAMCLEPPDQPLRATVVGELHHRAGLATEHHIRRPEAAMEQLVAVEVRKTLRSLLGDREGKDAV